MEKDIFKIILGYLKYWYLFLIGAIICLVLAFLHIRYNVVPEYYVSGKILLDDKEEGEGGGGLQSLSNLGLIKNSKNIQDEIGVLQSYDLMLQTLKELGFSVVYYAEGRFSEIEVYEKALPFKVVLNDSLPYRYGTIGKIKIVDEFSYIIETINDDESVKISTYNFGEIITSELGEFHVELTSNGFDLESQSPVKVSFRNLNQEALFYSSKMGVYNVYEGGGGLIEMSLTDAIPQRGIDVVNKVIQVYAQNSAENKNFLANATLNLIDERLELLTTDLNVAEKDVETYKRSNDLTDVGSDAVRFVELADQVDRELAGLRLQINALNALEASIQSSGQTFSPINSYNNIDSPVINGYIQTYNSEIQKRKALISASGTGNPMLPDIDRQLLETKNIILVNVRNIKAQLTRSQRDLINKSIQYRSKISSVPSAERALLEINRDQGIKQSLYLYLLQKREEEALSISVPFSDTRIIETPKATTYPVTGAKTPIYFGAILFGVFIPFVFLFVKNLLNTKIHHNEDIEAVVDNPILGKIGSSKSKDVVVVTENNTSPVAELFRLMRHNLKFLSKGKGNQVIMVTSGKPGEGKTFVSINLAASLAITGRKVIVLGFDLRAPKLMKDVGLTYNYGLSDYIVDPLCNVNDIITPYDKNNNLFFVGSGAVPPNPGELMLSDRVEELINILKKTYDYVIIDTPPIGKVSDAYALSNFVDSSLFVVRYNYTKKVELNLINEINENKKLNPLMIVFNDIKTGKPESYGGYGYGNTKYGKKK